MSSGLLIDLDDPLTFQRLDPLGMLDHIQRLPRQVSDAWDAVSGLSLPDDCHGPAAVLLLGMGGSAIGGDLVRDLVLDSCPVVFQVNRDYQIPAWVGPGTLVIASSYSGNTEETLSGVEAALGRGAAVVGISSGGQLSTRLRTAGRPVIPIRYVSQPRAALGHSFVPVLGILRAADLIADPALALAGLGAALESVVARNRPEAPTSENPAKQIALSLSRRIAVIYGSGLLSAVARRWKTQINENSKAWALYEEFPELNHNAVLGYQFPAGLDCLHIVLLDSPFLDPRVRRRYEVTRQILNQHAVPFTAVEAEGADRLSQMFGTILLGDFVSYYLAMLYEVDPTPVTAIDFLKQELARS